MSSDIFTAEWTKQVFPPERTNEFFEALFGDPEEGAYNIELAFMNQDGKMLEFVFNLHQRGSRCLACNLTHGLPKVFERHPIINTAGIAQKAAEAVGGTLARWQLGFTEEHSKALHSLPLYVWLA
ncbi:pancreas/duodenum homeobox protein 1 [Desulfovibrio sp. OttesenSCG-928-F07]|nr:pancreas/duodenum homeobox protein 1 [Desulfovibrio sp. OttesenSCG-928-F07]